MKRTVGTDGRASVSFLSVVVVPVCGQGYLSKCLTALLEQAASSEIEIIVPCDPRLDDISSLRARFPTVQFHPTAHRKTTEELRALGVRQASGMIVALTEDHCIPDENWCRRIREAHRSPYAAIGGTVEKRSGPDALLNWAVYFFDLGRYQSPVPRGPASKLCDCNVAYKRQSLDQTANMWRQAFHVAALNWMLLAGGQTLWLSPDIVVWHHRDFRLGDVLGEAAGWGRSFASARVAAADWPKRLFFAAVAPLLPLVLLARIAVDRVRKRRNLGVFLLAAPLIALLALTWSWGEFMGYLRGRAVPVSRRTRQGSA